MTMVMTVDDDDIFLSNGDDVDDENHVDEDVQLAPGEVMTMTVTI